MNNYILRFEETGKNDIAAAGGKGANLGELTSAGIPVPPGGVLTAQAYASYIEHNGIDVSAASGENGAQKIRNAILAGEFPEDIRSQALSLYRSLGAGARVAVRSSATAEDLEDASFAGQQETYLNVTGEDELLDSVKKCYASLWGDRAVSYRAKQGYDKQPPLLAVVIQLMVESDCAGVCFTADPTGRGGVIINASYGLGEAVVSGLVSPDEYRCSRDGKLLGVVIGSKSEEIAYGENGTVRRPVDSARSAARVLDGAQLERLVSCAMDIEKHYGHPMDIEWAMKDGRLYILQARSITAAAGGGKTFSEADFAGLPKARQVKGRMRENMLFNLEKLPRPYYPLDHDFGDAVGRQKEKLIAEAGVRMDEMCPIDGDGISSFSFGGMRPGAGITRIPALVRQLKNDRENVRISSELLERYRSRLEKERSLDPETPAQIGASLERMLELISETAYARFRYAIFPQVLENIGLGKALRKIGGRLTPFDLMDGLSYVTADIDRGLAEISRYIERTPGLREEVMNKDYARLCAGHPALAAKFADFLGQFGCRSDYNCYCFSARSWNECPDRFLGTLRTMLRGGANVPSAEEGLIRFDGLKQKLRGSVSAGKYAKLERKISAVRHYHYIREATQYLWESEFELCRKLLGRCAEALGSDYGDLIYLFSEELFKACREGRLSDEAALLIQKRKNKRPLAEAYWDHCVETALSGGGGGIKGVSGSAGTASGKVCVVSGPGEFDKLQRGEILVCPHTDPEWTPLFTLAAGVVVDTGGTLSHAAIVAREYGIPAVLAAGNATKRLRDGDSVLVDGTSGTVTILV